MASNDHLKVSEAEPELHHYTDRTGLEGIWKTGVIYATRYDCLNDSAEINHLQRALNAAVEDRVRRLLIEEARHSLKMQLRIKKAGGLPLVARDEAKGLVGALYQATFVKSTLGDGFAVPYIASFCKHGSDQEYERHHGLLSQWRAYGGKERYALVFETAQLEALLEEEAKRFAYPFLNLIDVVYDDAQLNFATEFGDLIDEVMKAYPPREYEHDLSALLKHFVTAATRLKHRGFREEREVRVVACPNFRDFIESLNRKAGGAAPELREPKELHYRGDASVPFIKLFDWRLGQRLPIRRIIVGPHRQQAKLTDEIKRLTRNAVRVITSDTPFIG